MCFSEMAGIMEEVSLHYRHDGKSYLRKQHKAVVPSSCGASELDAAGRLLLCQVQRTFVPPGAEGIVALICPWGCGDSTRAGLRLAFSQ